MSEEAQKLFEAFFALEDVREILRETAPSHRLSKEQKERVKGALAKIKESVDFLERLAK